MERRRPRRLALSPSAAGHARCRLATNPLVNLSQDFDAHPCLRAQYASGCAGCQVGSAQALYGLLA